MSKINGRQSIRLQGYDYAKPGWYFVTICTKNRIKWFGDCRQGNMFRSMIGEMAHESFINIPHHFKNTKIDTLMVMPDHVHGIIKILGNVHQHGGVGHVQPLHGNERSHSGNEKINRYQHIITGSIGSMVRGYKSSVTKWARENGYNDFEWQRNYWEKIIQTERQLFNCREYIQRNPKDYQK